jgi:hypothetical protein
VAWLPTAAAELDPNSGHTGFVVKKWHWYGFSSSTLVFPANSFSNYSKFIMILYLKLHNEVVDKKPKNSAIINK